MVTDISTSGLVYNTGEKSRKQIDEEFVRQAEFQMIMEDIRTSTMEFPEQEYLIIGEKGMGKTMLLTKLKYEIEKDAELKDWLIPVSFPEELNGATDLFDLWVQVAEYLEAYTQRTSFKGLSDAMIAKNGDEEQAFFLLNEALKTHQKKIILLIDNFGTFLDELGEKEDHRLREILITNTNIRIVATHSHTIQDVHRYDKAFYEHFIEIKLKGLSREETERLMLKLGKIYGGEKEIEKIIENEPYRIETLRHLTGGNIRKLAMLFNILLTDKNQDFLGDLIQILDDITPRNIGKITQLKKNQKKIINYIALQWDAVRTAEIAKALRMKSNEVSAQLNYLAENQWIVTKGNGRKKLYQLRDRFFNIWYLMRYGTAKHRNQLKWLMGFYKAWDDSDFTLKVAIEAHQKISSLDTATHLAYAYVQNDKIEDAIKTAELFMHDAQFIENNQGKILRYLIGLLQKKQIHIVYNYFTNENLQIEKIFKPLWYATIFLKEGKSSEFLKMGDELQEIVQLIIEQANSPSA